MSTPSWERVGHVTTWETIPFSHVGVLTVRPGRSRYPVTGGTFRIVAVAASLDTPPTGDPAIIDVNKNGVSIYPDQASQPAIPPDATLAVAGEHTATTVTDGDYLTVDIDQVGALTPGADLVVSVRLQRIP